MLLQKSTKLELPVPSLEAIPFERPKHCGDNCTCVYIKTGAIYDFNFFKLEARPIVHQSLNNRKSSVHASAALSGSASSSDSPEAQFLRSSQISNATKSKGKGLLSFESSPSAFPAVKASFCCPYCDKHFKTKCNLTKHVKTHNNTASSPTFSCPYYNKVLTEKK